MLHARAVSAALRSRNTAGRRLFCTNKRINEPAVEPQPETAYKPGIFSRNPGVVFGSILLTIGAYVYRNSRGSKNFKEIQQSIVESNAISPYEAFELRSSNEITIKDFASILSDLKSTFPTGLATFSQFDNFLATKLKASAGRENNNDGRIKNGHHLERVLKSLPVASEANGERLYDVLAMTTAFSMAVKGSSDERLLCLYGLFSSNDDSSSTEISRKQFETLLCHATSSFQIPSEKQVLPIEPSYPFQTYTRASASMLLDKALSARVKDEKMSPEVLTTVNSSFTFEEFIALLKSKQICIWGECFASGSKRRLRN